MKRRQILYLDDDPGNLSVFEMLFLQTYQVYVASRAADAEAILAQEPIDILLVDQRMPDLTGLEFLARIRDRYPRLIKFVVTAYADLGNVLEAINAHGVYRYVMKPWDREELALALANAVHLLDVEDERTALQAELEAANHRLTRSLTETQQLNQQLSAYALRFMNLQKRLEAFRTQAQKLHQHVQTLQQHDRELQGQLHTLDRSEDQWEDFLGLFERMQVDFLQRLQTQFPALTASERRLCVLLRMGLTSKEIAAANNISPQSVNMARYRLRKKLDLGEDEALEPLLSAI